MKTTIAATVKGKIMAKLYEIICDHCGKKLDEMKDYYESEIKINHETYKPDLCSECFCKLCVAVSDFCTANERKEQ